ncbi:MAG TPA: hypothetical protein VFS46_00400 [Nitrososphaera sp.]|nr:hypothetical protein [Nitrososphaera sp.]
MAQFTMRVPGNLRFPARTAQANHDKLRDARSSTELTMGAEKNREKVTSADVA